MVLIAGLGRVGALKNLMPIAADVLVVFMAIHLRVLVEGASCVESSCQSMDAGFVGVEPLIRKIEMKVVYNGGGGS